MKLVHQKLSCHMDFREGCFNVLTIEHSQFFKEIVQDLIWQIQGNDGPFVLSHNSKELDFKKNVELILNPFEIDSNQKRILTYIYNEMRLRAYNQDNYHITTKITSELEKLLIDLSDDMELPLSIDKELDFDFLLKSFNVQVMSLEQELSESIVSYMELLTKLTPGKVFVVINLYDYLTDEKINDLLYDLNLKKINVALIQRHQSNSKHRYEKPIVIDKDLCEIY